MIGDPNAPPLLSPMGDPTDDSASMGAQPQAPPQSPQDMYGPNFEKLPEDIQAALIGLVEKLEKENIQARGEEVRKIQRQREFFKGNQNLYWSQTDRRWKGISASSGTGLQTKDGGDEGAVSYDFVENIYRANGLITIAVLSQNPPHCEFAPQDPSNPDDISTSKAATDVEEFIGDNNKLDQRQADVCWYWYNDGLCASYTYWEANADKYGVKQVPRIEPVQTKLTPDTLHCNCGQDAELPDMDYTDPASMASMPMSCAGCQQPLGQQNFVPGLTGMVPQQTGVDEFPLGMERIIYIGALELARPFFAKTLEECPWITWETEVHKSWIKSIYPDAISRMASANSEGGGDSAEQTARSARIALAGTALGRTMGEAWGSLITFRRTWLRSWAFQGIEDEEMRGRVQDLFPDGAYVARAGSAYCESRSEPIEKRWALKHCFSGDGMIRDGIGTDIIDVQRRLNVEENIQTDTFERGLPTRFIDDRVVDFDAYIEGGSQAALDFPAQGLPGQPLSAGIYDTPPVVASPQMIEHTDKLRGPIPQFLLGTFPTIFGGDTGGNDTASGISMEKDSAYGRFALFKRSLNEFYADTMLNAIDCFVENRTDDVKLSVFGKGGELDAKTIKLEDLRGNLYARTEADDSYPVSVVQKRSLVLSMMQSPNPQVQAAMTAPDNFEILKTALGLQDLRIPGEDARRKQFREIRQMLETGQTIPPDVLLDQHKVEEAACQEWWSSDEGQQAAQSNPQGAEAVRQHFMAHLTAEAQLAQIQAGQVSVNGQGQPPAPAPANGQPQQVQ